MTMDYEIKDSGTRESFSTGSVRDSQEGKGRYDLVPYEPLRRLAVHYENGAKKYGDGNWMKGQSISRYLCSAQRHLEKVKAGMECEDHITAVSWNSFAIVWTREAIKAGKLPESLEDVFDDEQFKAFYGRDRAILDFEVLPNPTLFTGINLSSDVIPVGTPMSHASSTHLRTVRVHFDEVEIGEQFWWVV
jgi:hypothetical protein